MATPIDVVVFKCRKICPTGMVRYLPDKKQNVAASQTVATARIAPKICQGQHPKMCSKCSKFHSNRFTFKFRRSNNECVNTVFCPVEYFYDRLFERINIVNEHVYSPNGSKTDNM